MIGKDSYLQGTPDENAINSGCEAGEVSGELPPVILRVHLGVPVVMIAQGGPPQLVHHTRLPGGGCIKPRKKL